MAAHRMTERRKALRLACWNADGVRGRKLELEHFLSQHGVDICLLIETFITLSEPEGLPIMSATTQTDKQQRAAEPSCSAVVWCTTQCLFRA